MADRTQVGQAQTSTPDEEALQRAVYDSLLAAMGADLLDASFEEQAEALAVLTKLSRKIAKRLQEELAGYGLDHARFLELVRGSDEALAYGETVTKSTGVNRAAKEFWFRGMDADMIGVLLGLSRFQVDELIASYSAQGREAVRLHVTTDLSLADIAEKLGMSISWARKLLVSVGETPRAAVLDPVSPKVRSRMVDLRLAGKSYGEIAKAVGLDLTKVKNVLKYEARKGRIPGYQGAVEVAS